MAQDQGSGALIQEYRSILAAIHARVSQGISLGFRV